MFRYSSIILTCVFFLAVSVLSARAKDGVISSEQLIKQFDNWVFANGKYQKIAKIDATVMRIGLTEVETYFTNHTTNIKIFSGMGFLSSFSIIPRTHVSEASIKYLESGSFIRREKVEKASKIKIIGGTTVLYNTILRKFESLLKSKKNISFKVEDYNSDINCKFRRYTILQNKKSIFSLPYLAKKEIISVVTLANANIRGLPGSEKEKRALACAWGAVYTHFGLLNVYSVAIKRPDIFIQSNAKNLVEWSNLFPLWAIYQPEINNGMTRKDALNEASKLTKKWIRFNSSR